MEFFDESNHFVVLLEFLVHVDCKIGLVDGQEKLLSLFAFLLAFQQFSLCFQQQKEVLWCDAKVWWCDANVWWCDVKRWWCVIVLKSDKVWHYLWVEVNKCWEDPVRHWIWLAGKKTSGILIQRPGRHNLHRMAKWMCKHHLLNYVMMVYHTRSHAYMLTCWI